MKYYLLNRDEVKKDIWVNPILVRLKCWSKIKRYKALKKKLDYLYKQIETDIKTCNSDYSSTPEIIEKLIVDDTITEITSKDYNALYGLALYDTQEQRIKVCNKSNVLKGKLFGHEIR